MAAGDKRYLEFVVLGRPGETTRRYRISRVALTLLLLAIPGVGLAAGYVLGSRHARATRSLSVTASTPVIPMQTEHVAQETAARPIEQVPAPQHAATIAPAEPEQAAAPPRAVTVAEAVPAGESLSILRSSASEEVIELHPFAPDGSARASDFDLLEAALACPDGRNQRPDPALVRVLIAAQHKFDKPLLFLGGRCPAHKDHSDTEDYHRTGRAADVRVRGVPSDELMAWAVERGAGGAGRYKQAGFVHIDVRPGAPEQWRGEETPAAQTKQQPEQEPDSPAAVVPEPAAATQPAAVEAAKPAAVPEATP